MTVRGPRLREFPELLTIGVYPDSEFYYLGSLLREFNKVNYFEYTLFSGKRQHLAVAHEKGKLTVLQLSALLKQADSSQKKLTITRLASAPVPFTVLSIVSNPSNEDYLAVTGLKVSFEDAKGRLRATTLKSAKTVYLILLCYLGDAIKCAVSADFKMVARNRPLFRYSQLA